MDIRPKLIGLLPERPVVLAEFLHVQFLAHALDLPLVSTAEKAGDWLFEFPFRSVAGCWLVFTRS